MNYKYQVLSDYLRTIIRPTMWHHLNGRFTTLIRFICNTCNTFT